MKVENSSKGNFVPNQFIIEDKNGLWFQSYRTMIAYKNNDGSVKLDKDWKYSRTTSKYLYSFLDQDRKEIERNIKSGLYEVTDLNN